MKRLPLHGRLVVLTRDMEKKQKKKYHPQNSLSTSLRACLSFSPDLDIAAKHCGPSSPHLLSVLTLHLQASLPKSRRRRVFVLCNSLMWFYSLLLKTKNPDVMNRCQRGSDAVNSSERYMKAIPSAPWTEAFRGPLSFLEGFFSVEDNRRGRGVKKYNASGSAH